MRLSNRWQARSIAVTSISVHRRIASVVRNDRVCSGTPISAVHGLTPQAVAVVFPRRPDRPAHSFGESRIAVAVARGLRENVPHLFQQRSRALRLFAPGVEPETAIHQTAGELAFARNRYPRPRLTIAGTVFSLMTGSRAIQR